MGTGQGPGGGAAAEPAHKCGPTLHRGMRSVGSVETGPGAAVLRSAAAADSSKAVQAGVPPAVAVVAIALPLLPGCPTMLLC